MLSSLRPFGACLSPGPNPSALKSKPKPKVGEVRRFLPPAGGSFVVPRCSLWVRPARARNMAAAGVFTGLQCFIDSIMYASNVFAGSPDLAIAIQSSLFGYALMQVVVTYHSGVRVLIAPVSYEVVPFLKRLSVIVRTAVPTAAATPTMFAASFIVNGLAGLLYAAQPAVAQTRARARARNPNRPSPRSRPDQRCYSASCPSCRLACGWLFCCRRRCSRASWPPSAGASTSSPSTS